MWKVVAIDRVIVGTAAAEHPEQAAALFAEFGERLVLGLDARDGRVAVRGWEAATEWDAVDLAQRLVAVGARRIVFTDIARDGALTGPAIDSTRQLARAVGVPVVASGGIRSVADIAALAALAAEGVEA